MAIFVTGRLSGLVFLLILAFLLWYYLGKAMKGEAEKIRPLAALDAIDEAVGRSAEMGKPVLVTYGYPDRIDPAIMAGLETVGYVAKVASEKNCEVIVGVGPTRTLPIAIENYRTGCMEAGRPELFNADNVYYFTHEQRAYISGMFGLINNRDPGAYIGVGWFWVDCVHVGTQVRREGLFGIGGVEKYDAGAWFFITMNYTAIGAEMYALAAAMSGDPTAIAGITSEDVLKWISNLLIIVGAIFTAAGSNLISNLLGA
jgi:hypothetical protein